MKMQKIPPKKVFFSTPKNLKMFFPLHNILIPRKDTPGRYDLPKGPPPQTLSLASF